MKISCPRARNSIISSHRPVALTLSQWATPQRDYISTPGHAWHLDWGWVRGPHKSSLSMLWHSTESEQPPLVLCWHVIRHPPSPDPPIPAPQLRVTTDHRSPSNTWVLQGRGGQVRSRTQDSGAQTVANPPQRGREAARGVTMHEPRLSPQHKLPCPSKYYETEVHKW
jgi:hypothetical protein